MSGFKNGGPEGNLTMVAELRPLEPEHPLDLGHLANKLNAIAAQLRGEETNVGPPQSKRALSSSRELHARRIAKNSKHPTKNLRADRSGPHVSKFAPHPPQRRSETDQAIRLANADFAREIYSTRRRRSGIFGHEELFGEPAWDILLDLYIAYVDQKPVSVSSACIGSAAPPTTGLRWLGVLSEHGFVLREHDPQDQRRVLVRLTELGLSAMDEYFASSGLSA
ncbi:MAG: MarR family transcriptional regulator [Pseudomonadota bacterium]